MVCNGNRIWEFGNEINMDNAGIAVSKDGIGGAVLLEPYVAWLKNNSPGAAGKTGMAGN